MKKLFFTVLLALFAVGAQAQDFGEYLQNEEKDYTWEVEGVGGTIKCYYHYSSNALVIQPKDAGNSCAMKDYRNSKFSEFINETKKYWIGNGYVSLVDLIYTVDIKEGITNIGSYCFAGKTNIGKLVLPNSVTSINSNAFAYTGLNVVSGNINANINVAEDAFTNTSLIDDEQGLLYFGNVLVKAYSNYLEGDYEFVEVKSGTTKINPRAFEGYEMGKVTIPSSVTSIEDGTFKNCANLTNVTFKGNISTIGTEAFKNCAKLTNVSFSGNVSSIGNEAFSGCEALESINIPNTVETWGSDIFSGCTKLPTVDGYKMAGDNVIVDVVNKNKTKYNIEGISYIAENAFSWVSGKVECFGSIPMAASSAFEDFSGNVYVNDGDETTAKSKLKVVASKINHYTIRVSAAEFSTVSLPFCSDVSNLTGVTVYRAVEDADAGLIKLTKVDKMDKDYGYVVYRMGGGDVTFTPNGSSYTELNPNQMVGCDDGDVVSGADKYVLSLNSEGEVEFQCLDLNSATIPAGKSYFKSNSDTPLKSLRTAFDNTTGIEDVYEGKTSQKKSGIYSLSGQRLSQARKGLNIINGQVVLK